LLSIFGGGPIVYGVQRVDGALLLTHLLAIKIVKNELEARKL
jgi:hypothetical protein